MGKIKTNACEIPQKMHQKIDLTDQEIELLKNIINKIKQSTK
jgi:hypothetical protein